MTLAPLLFAAGGQDAVPPPVAENAEGVRADVYIDDSLEARDKIERAKRLARRGQWLDAAVLLHEVTDSAGDKLVKTSSLSYTGIREYVSDIVAEWPPDGIAVYQRLVEPDLQAALREAPDADLGQLIRWFDRYFCTETAAELADRIGQLAVEAGELDVAERAYRRVLQRHPDADRYAPRYRAMVMVIRAMRGDDTTVSPSDLALPLRWKGEDRTVGAVLPEIATAFASMRRHAPRADWPMLGGDAARNRTSPCAVDELGLLWRFDGFLTSPSETDGNGEELTLHRWREAARQLTVQPVVVDDLVFVQRYREIMAIQRNTGTLVWRYTPEYAAAVQPGDLDDVPPGCDAVTVSGGRVFASIGGEIVPYYGYETAQHPPELACLDARTGHLIWRTENEGEAFAEVSFDSSPIVHGDSLYVVGRRRRSFGFEDCYLYRFSANDGTVQGRTHLGSASTGTFGARRATMSVSAKYGDTLFICTNIGSVAAVAAHTGTVRWLRVYERDGDTESREGAWTVRDMKPWAFNSVIVHDGRVYCLPIDAPDLLVLSADDGRVVKAIPKADLADMISFYGVRDGLLCGLGDRAVCYDLESDSVRWESALPPTARVLGRGVWTGNRILVPTTEGLSVYSQTEGGRTDVRWDTDGGPGNVLALSDSLLVAGDGYLSAYVRKADIWKAIRERMAAAPKDPRPALEFAEVALQGGELEEAVEALDEAVRRAGGLLEPPEPAVRRRFYGDVRAFVDVFQKRDALSHEMMDKLAVLAGLCAPDHDAHVEYRLQFARLYEQADRFGEALALYQQILRDRSLRERHVVLDSESSESGGAIAQARIAALLKEHGREIYASFEAEASRMLDMATRAGDDAMLERVAAVFPNSESAPRALIAMGDLRLAQGLPLEAASIFCRAYRRLTDEADRAPVIKRIAGAYVKGNRPDHAYRWLTKAAREMPAVTIDHQGRRMGFLELRDVLVGARSGVEPRRPRVRLPFDVSFTVSSDPKWRLLVPRFSSSTGVDWSRFFVDTPDGVRAYSAGGTEIWDAPVSLRATPELLFAGGRVAVLATLFEVVGVDAATGRVQWAYGEYPPDFDPARDDWEAGPAFRTHALHGDRLVSVREDGRMSAVSIGDGTVQWTRGTDPLPIGAVRLDDSWVAYHIAGENAQAVMLLDAATGELHTRVDTDESRPIESFFTTLDGQLIVLSSRSLSAYDIDSSLRRWRVALDGHFRAGTLATSLDAVFFSDNGQTVKKVALDNGMTIWETEDLVRRGEDDLAVQRFAGYLFLTSSSSVSAVDEVSGLTLWRGITPNFARLLARIVTENYLVALDIAGEHREEASRAFFYDHRQASGVIPNNGGALDLGKIDELRAVLVLDDALLIQSGDTIHGWTRKK